MVTLMHTENKATTNRRRVTIQDVARDTGLAFSTVSNALAGKSYVRPETRKIVMEAVERLGYRASTVARTMRLQRSFIVGVLIADVSNPSSADFVRGIEDVLSQGSCTMLLCNSDGDERKQLLHMQTLIDHQVDGIVMISQHCSSDAVKRLLSQSPPVVMVQRRGDAAYDYVGSDNHFGIIDAMRHAHALDHRRVGFVRGPSDSSSAQERLSTFRQEAAKLGFDPDEDLIFPGEYTFESGLAAGAHFMRMNMRPTAVLCSSDMNAMGTMQYLMDSGLKIPDDMSIIGLDDITLANFRSINLTTIHLEKREIGAEAAKVLLNRISDPSMPSQEIILPTRLIVRGTTKQHRR